MYVNNDSSAYKLEPIIERAQIAKSGKTPRYRLQNKNTIKTVFIIIAIFAASCFVLARYVEISGQNELIQKKNTEISTVEALNTQIALSIEKKIDLKEIERYAYSELGMQKPERGQIVYIAATGADIMEKSAAAQTKEKQVVSE